MTQIQRSRAEEKTDRFIERIEKKVLNAAIERPYFLAKFRVDNFSPDLFRVHAIDFPTQIRNSTPKRQAEFMAGRLCAQLGLSSYGYFRHSVATGTYREPIWPDAFAGSITHNSQYAAAILCPKIYCTGIGIDIETVISRKMCSAMINSVVSSEELDYLYSVDAHLTLDCLLTLVFSAKESFFKAAFCKVRRYFNFDAIRILSLDPRCRTIQFRSTQTLCDDLVAGQVYHAYYDFLDRCSIFTVVVLNSANTN